jgi:K+-sensing histidine kinase KdpD
MKFIYFPRPRRIEFICHNTKLSREMQNGSFDMTNVESNLQPGVVEIAEADPLASRWVNYIAAIAMTAFATVVALAVDSKINIPNLSLVFVIPVIVAGLSSGLGPSLCSAVLGALAFNFFLTEPRYSLAVDDPSNVWAIALLFVVGMIVSGVAFTSRRRAEEAALLQKQATILENYSRDVVAAKDETSVASLTSRALASLFRAPVVVMGGRQGKLVCLTQPAGAAPGEVEFDAAQSALAAATPVRGGVYPHPASRFDFWPVRTAEAGEAVVGIAFDPDERPSAPDSHVGVVVSLFGLTLDRLHERNRAQ